MSEFLSTKCQALLINKDEGRWIMGHGYGLAGYHLYKFNVCLIAYT